MAVYGYEDKENTKLVKSFNTLQLFLQSYNLKGHGGLTKAIKENKQYKFIVIGTMSVDQEYRNLMSKGE